MRSAPGCRKYGHDGVDGVGVAATDEMAQFLVDDVERLPLLYFGLSSLIFADTMSPMPPSLAWPYWSSFPPSNTISPPLKVAPSEMSTMAYLLGLSFRSSTISSVSKSTSKGMFGDDAAVGRARHGGQHGAVKPAYRPEDLQHHDALVGAGGGAGCSMDMVRVTQVLEADAVVGARHVVVHGLGNATTLMPFW